MTWSRESEADYLARRCRELQLPEDDEAGNGSSPPSMRSTTAQPEWRAAVHLRLGRRVVERLVADAIEGGQTYVASDSATFSRAAFHHSLVMFASEDGNVGVRDRGLDVGGGTGVHRTIVFGHHEGPAAVDAAIWWRDDTEPDCPHGRVAVFIRFNDDGERLLQAVVDALTEGGWDVRVLFASDVEADPVGIARSLLRAPVPTPSRGPVRPYLVKGPDGEA